MRNNKPGGSTILITEINRRAIKPPEKLVRIEGRRVEDEH